MKRKTVYICYPFSGPEREGNIEVAKLWSRRAYQMGYLPICVHIYLEEATGLDEKNGERKKIMDLCLGLLDLCDELWVCSSEVSPGMKIEIRYARVNKIKRREIWRVTPIVTWI